MDIALADVLAALGGELHGNRDLRISGVASLEDAGPTDISFLSNPRYQQQLQASKAGCVIVGRTMEAAARQRVPASLPTNLTSTSRA